MSQGKVEKCPKCSGPMKADRRLVSYTEISLAKEQDSVGDEINVFYCGDCGYIELYK